MFSTKEIALNLNIIKRHFNVKIVQLIVAPNDCHYQGALLGLGSDGVIYRADNDNMWHVYFPCEFANARAEEVTT